MNRKNIALLLLTAVWTLSSLSNDSFAEQPKLTPEALDRLAEPYVNAGIVQAMSVGVIDGQRTWTRHYG